MRTRHHYTLAVLVFLTLSACGTTHRYVDHPALTMDGTDQSARMALRQVLGDDLPYQVLFCEADPVSKNCKKDGAALQANGVGGLFIPLVLKVTGLTVIEQDFTDSAWAIEAAVQSKADAIPPLCRTAHGEIVFRDDNAVGIQLKNFYCNWLVVGNVIVTANFSIDHIDSQNKFFSGFYKIVFHGTGNAAGSGYFRAAIAAGPSTP
jgi:hypothetical protein